MEKQTATLESKSEEELLEMFRFIVATPGPITDTQMDDIITIAREFNRRENIKAAIRFRQTGKR